MTSIRLGKPTEVDAIYALLEEAAPEIPVVVSDGRDVKLKGLIASCCKGNRDGHRIWVAVNASGTIIAFLMLRRERGLHVRSKFENIEYIELSYGGVSKNSRGGKVFRRLIDKAKAAKKPLRGDVKHANQSGMASILVHYGFKKEDAIDHRQDEDVFVLNFPSFSNPM